MYPMIYDLAISFVWIYDTEFTQLIEKMFQNKGFSTFIIGKFNLNEVTQLVRNNELKFKAYLDRASDEDESFIELGNLIQASGTYIINDYKNVEKAIDKSVMHPILLDAGITIPKTIIVPPYDKKPDVVIENLEEIGIPFVIKPAYYSGAGWGVIKDASTIEKIEETRRENPDDNYLVQQRIHPKTINTKRAWFRPLFAFGSVIITFWDDQTHIYNYITEKEATEHHLEQINSIVRKIESLAKLDYFSCEIALTEDNRFYLIDYVNDQCDMRLKSNHPDGVPDDIVEKFISVMMEFIAKL